MKKSPAKGNVYCERDAGESSTQDSDNVNIKTRQKRKVARDENDDFLIFKNEIKEWLRTFQREQNTRLDKLQDQQNSRLDSVQGRIEELSSKLSSVNTTSQVIEKSIDFVSEKMHELQKTIDGIQSSWNEVSSQVTSLVEQHEALARSLHKTSL